MYFSTRKFMQRQRVRDTVELPAELVNVPYSTKISLMIAIFFMSFLFGAASQAQVTSQDYLGAWSMTQQMSSTPAGSIAHNFNNKIITVQQTDSGFQLIEDYSQMTLVNPDDYPLSNCTTAGRYETPIEVNDDGLVADGSQRVVLQEPDITCPGGGDPSLGGTNAVPFSLTVGGTAVAKDGSEIDSTWKYTLKENTLIATITLGPSTTTQTYQRSSDSTGVGVDLPDAIDVDGTLPEEDINENVNSANNVNKNVINELDPVDQNDVVDVTLANIELSETEIVVQQQALTEYDVSGNEIPAKYKSFTTEVVELTPQQQQEIQFQIESDLAENTQLVVDAPNNTVQVVREVGWKPQESQVIGSVQITGQVDTVALEQLGLPSTSPIYIVVTVFSTPIVKIAQTDESGAWTLTIPAELLAADQHIAYAAAEVNGIQTNQIEVTKFVVEEQVRLSNTTWLVVINGSIIGIILIALLIIRIRQRKQKQAYI